ncbi:hypothetical protein [Aeromonas caviae]|uniref:hypothetical protein n=1 Tax=Aeromonas caviae TaxID=648 RepID=UPI001CC50E6F|nr:hypothetical protein [Aeromonas caviae]GJA96496.1 hypothetical protein KAM358_43280 [Aeromonas caviae]
MTELERILLDRLERIETAHQQQTAALDLQLKQQARSLNELQTACTSALVQAVCNSFKERACCFNCRSKAAVCCWCAVSIRSSLSSSIRSSSVIQFTSTAILSLSFTLNGFPNVGARM